MSSTDYLEGFAFAIGVWGSVLAAAIVLLRRLFSHLEGAPRIVAGGILVSAGVLAAHLVPGILGVLSRESALAASVCLLAIAFVVPDVRRERDPALHGAESDRLSWVVAVIPAGALALWAAAWGAHVSVTPTEGLDAVSFHLPNVARWIQTGTFWQIDQFNPLLANGYYPHHGDVLFLSIVLPWKNDAFVQLLNLPYLALTALGVYAIAREIGAAKAHATLAASLFVSLPVVLFTAQKGAHTDLILLAALGGGVLFLLRHFRNGRRSELFLAGLALGLAFGTKWYGVPAVAVVLAVWTLSALVDHRRAAPVLRQAALLTGLIGLAGGFWLLRNWVEAGNPLFPVNVEIAGLTVFDAPRDPIRECAGFNIAHYFGDGRAWREFILPAFADNFAFSGLALASGAIVAALMLFVGLVRGRAPESSVLLPLSIAAFLLAVVYTLTPDTALGGEGTPKLTGANTRYLLPALLVGAALPAWALRHAGRWRLGAEVLLALAALDGLRRAAGLSLTFLGEVLLVLVLIAGGGLMAVRLARRAPPSAQIAAAMLGFVVVIALGDLRQRQFNDGRYAGVEPALDWILRHASEGHAIGLGGSWGNRGLAPIYPAFGPRLGNEVAYVGEFVRGQLREYRTRGEWSQALRSGEFDLLIVSTKGYNKGCPVPGSESDEHAWARAEGFPVLARSERLTLYRVRRANGDRIGTHTAGAGSRGQSSTRR